MILPAYCSKLTFVSLFPTLKLVNNFLSIAFLIKLHKPSTTILNKKGARGSSCLRPPKLTGKTSIN
ncbi:hypothetical protein GYH30_039364 [Glycine max]|nr:hypothetical protein GYH30_039364 [Glycine max]